MKCVVGLTVTLFTRLNAAFAAPSQKNTVYGIYYIFIYNFTEVQVSRVIIVLLLQNCFVWCEDLTHQAILTTGLLELEGWQLNAKIEMVAIVDALHLGYMILLKWLLGNKNII